MNTGWQQPGELLYIRAGRHQRQPLIDLKTDQPYIHAGSARWSPEKGWHSPFEEGR